MTTQGFVPATSWQTPRGEPMSLDGSAAKEPFAANQLVLAGPEVEHRIGVRSHVENQHLIRTVECR